MSADERRLGLSIKQLTEEGDRKKAKEFHSVGGDASTTLGDIFKQTMALEEELEAESRLEKKAKKAESEDAAADEALAEEKAE